MEPHGGPYGHQFTLHRPNFLRARLGEGQVVGPDQLEFDEVEGVGIFIVLVPLQSGLHDIIVLGAHFTIGTF